LFNRCGLGHRGAALAGGIAGEIVAVMASWCARVRQRCLLHARKCLHELCGCDDGGGFVGRKAAGLDSVAIASAAKPTSKEAG
jgi:hypothetical protein